jgi:Protein of unknown function (DUF4199)
MKEAKTQVVYGLGTGLVLIVTYIVFYVTGVAFNRSLSWMQNLVFVPFFVGLLLNAYAFTEQNKGYVTYGKVFFNCFQATMIITLIMVAYTLLSSMLFPNIKEKAIALAREKMAENPQMTEEIMDQSIAMTTKWWNVIMVSSVVFMELFAGAIFSLIVAIFPKKKGNQPIFEFEGQK